MKNVIELVLFSNNTEFVIKADVAGVDNFIVDLELPPEPLRQALLGKSIQADKASDIQKLKAITKKPIWSRINAYSENTSAEIESVIMFGADVILLPMVKTILEVTNTIDVIDGRAKVGILIETKEAINISKELSMLPIDIVYVGLFDLSLSLKSKDLFKPLFDGTVANLRKTFSQKKLGVAGLTTVDAGFPLPCKKIMEQLAKLNCNFTFLRNSFKKDVTDKNIKLEVKKIQQEWVNITRD